MSPEDWRPLEFFALVWDRFNHDPKNDPPMRGGSIFHREILGYSTSIYIISTSPFKVTITMRVDDEIISLTLRAKLGEGIEYTWYNAPASDNALMKLRLVA